ACITDPNTPRPSTRAPSRAAQDEEVFSMPSTISLILSRRAWAASRRTHGVDAIRGKSDAHGDKRARSPQGQGNRRTLCGNQGAFSPHRGEFGSAEASAF